jgi:hypothetical protein
VSGFATSVEKETEERRVFSSSSMPTFVAASLRICCAFCARRVDGCLEDLEPLAVLDADPVRAALPSVGLEAWTGH